MIVPSDQPTRIFYAYPSLPASARDAAETAVEHLSRMPLFEVIPWENLSVTGRLIPAEVFGAIDRADMLLADLTGLNANVLYEVGYAIGRGKRVWLVADTTRTGREVISADVPMLGTVGIEAYQNGHHIAVAFEKGYFNVIESRPLIEQFSSVSSSNQAPALLFMKALHETDASVRMTTRLGESSLSLITDDPTETNARGMAWYIERLLTAAGVLIHFTAADRSGSGPVNARYSLVGGMARGLGVQHLLIQEKSTSPVPLDFRDDVRTYATGREARAAVSEWLAPIESDHRQLAAKIDEDRSRIVNRASLQALHRGIGDFVAENDRALVTEYFIETAAYLDALDSAAPVIFVGRKGTGKTANLLKLADELGRSVNNTVCVIKPAGYDIAALAEVLAGIASDPARENAMVALWKYLLFTEIVAELSRDYERRLEARLDVSEEGGTLWNHADRHGWLESTFAERLESAIGSELPIDQALETIYREQVTPTLGDLSVVLRDKKRVCLLLDNIDKAWSRESDFSILSRFLLSLLVAAGEVHNLLSKRVRTRLELSTVVFVRSDIFEHIRRVAREPDKLPVALMRWNDPELLMRVVDERLRAATGMPAPETWARYFVASVDGVSPREYIVSRVLPRPRDVIVFTKATIASALNRGHSMVAVEDLKQAEHDYSVYALDSIKVENLPVASAVEEMLIQLMYGREIVTTADLDPMLRSLTDSAVAPEELVHLLVASSVLGREVADDKYEFAEDYAGARSLGLRASRFGHTRRLGSRFKIHVAFHRILDIRTV